MKIGEQFHQNNKDWSHYKNQEDYDQILQIPESVRYKIEKVYCDGRDMAYYMSDELIDINRNFSRFPTLTKIINILTDSWVTRHDKDAPLVALSICKDHSVTPWAIKEMCHLYDQQIEMLDAISATLNILKKTDLYKTENGIPIMPSNINISNTNSSNININSNFNSNTISKSTNDVSVFSEMKKHIEQTVLDVETQKDLIQRVDTLEQSYVAGSFTDTYKDFMANLSSHITVFTPFLSGLAAMLSCFLVNKNLMWDGFQPPHKSKLSVFESNYEIINIY